MSTEPTPTASAPAAPDMNAVMAASQAATAAAANATSAAEAATAAAKSISDSGLQLPPAVLDAIGQAAGNAWEQRMRDLGALVETDAATSNGDGDPTGDAAAAAAAAAAGVGAAVAGAAESADEIIYPTWAHKALGHGVRRADWGK